MMIDDLNRNLIMEDMFWVWLLLVGFLVYLLIGYIRGGKGFLIFAAIFNFIVPTIEIFLKWIGIDETIILILHNVNITITFIGGCLFVFFPATFRVFDWTARFLAIFDDGGASENPNEPWRNGFPQSRARARGLYNP